MLGKAWRVVRCVIAAYLLWYVWRQVGGVRWEGLAFGWFLAACVCGGLVVLGWALRWWFILRAHGLEVAFPLVAKWTLQADFFNFFFLGPIGADGFRWVALKRSLGERANASSVFGTVYLDHIIGLLRGVILFVFVSWPQRYALAGTILSATAWTMFAMTVLILGGIFASWDPIFRKHVREKKWFARIDFLMVPFDRLRRGPKLHLAGLTVSLASSLLLYAAFILSARALGSGLTWDLILPVLPMAEFASAVPVSVSGVGVRENLMVAFLGQAGLAMSLAGFAANAMWGLIGGLWLLFSRKR